MTIKKNVKLLLIIMIVAPAYIFMPESVRADGNTKNTLSAKETKGIGKEKAKIFVMFRGSGIAQEASTITKRAGWSAKVAAQKLVTNEEIMNELKKRCKGVEFVGDIHPIGTDVAINKVNNLSKEDIDGIVIFGPLSGGHKFGGPLTDVLIKTNLPIITVFPLWGMWQESFSYQGYKGKKILTAHIAMIQDASQSARFEDLAKKIKLIQAISKMKGLRILSITDDPPLGGYTPKYGDTKAYEKVCVDNLKKLFGVELITIPQEELFNKIREVKKSEELKAKQVAEMWIDGALEVKWDEVTKEDIVKSAEVYLAMKELRDRYNCGTVTTEGYGIFARYKKGAIPSQGLASMQLSTEGSLAAPSECLIYSLISQQLGFNITGRKGFNGDYIIDHFNHVAYIGHCEGPLDSYGDERMCPYIIRDLPQQYEKQCGGCVAVKYPVNETVTVLGMSIYDKKLSVFTGQAVSGRCLIEDFDNIYCRSKIAVETNTKALLENVNWEIFNQHRVVFYGDFREEFRNLATLIGFEFIEDDK